MRKTEICKLLGIEYPIIQASMAWVSNAQLVAAVSEAGGMGTLGPNAGAETITKDAKITGERLRSQIMKVRELTDKPFAVNFPIGIGKDRVYSDRCVEVGIEEKIPVAIVSEGSAALYTEKLHDAGIIVFHVVHTPKHAKAAEEAKVDAIITSGAEGGGHSGFEQLTTFASTPQITNDVDIPVVMGGGVVDGRGLAAALVLGAAGVYVGTRFLVTIESSAHQNVKELLLRASEGNTVSLGHGPGRYTTRLPGTIKEGFHRETESIFVEERQGSIRVIFNEFIKEVFDLERSGASVDEVQRYFNSAYPDRENCHRYMGAMVFGDVVKGLVPAGQGVGAIKDIPSCEELIKRMIKEAEKALEVNI